MRCCCVPFCSSRKNEHEKTSFHTFPANLKLRCAWIKAILRRAAEPDSFFQPSDWSLVCGKHFAENDFSVSTKNRTLLPNAVPSIFLDYPAADALQRPLNESSAYEFMHNYASMNKSMLSIPRNEKLSVKRKCLKEHFETSVLKLKKDENQLEANGDIQCNTQNVNNLKRAETNVVKSFIFSSEKRKTPTPINEEPFVKKKCVEEHFETSVVKFEKDRNQLEINGDIQCNTQNVNNLKRAEAHVVKSFTFSSKKRKTPTPINEEPFVKKKCIEAHFETSVVKFDNDSNHLEINGEIQCTNQNINNLNRTKIKVVTPFTFSSEKRKTSSPVNEAPFVKKKCVEEPFETFVTESETDVDTLDQDGDMHCHLQNANNLQRAETKAVTPIVYFFKKKKSSVQGNEGTSVKKSSVEEQSFDTAVTETETCNNQFEQCDDVQFYTQSSNNQESSDTNEITRLQKQIQTLTEENSNLCNIIVTLNHKINLLQSQKKKVSKKKILENAENTLPVITLLGQIQNRS